ncbi:hypothetical protein TorRG33x02_344550 [Trema orientale]|uniref:Uncharacterized protein n=1 Tax=Trema orientale TaxID=63057 RepID=A0A2P5AQ40_TREOI|nr:hypothetical protein TorRG33x02_344550 [Trema orientale]
MVLDGIRWSSTIHDNVRWTRVFDGISMVLGGIRLGLMEVSSALRNLGERARNTECFSDLNKRVRSENLRI